MNQLEEISVFHGISRELFDSNRVERRSKVRFPFDLQVRYRTLGRESVSGEGRAINISSGGMLVARSRQLRMGALVELRIDWPLLLDGRIGLQLVATGNVVRSGASSFAVLFSQHQFRTTGNKSRPESPAAIRDSHAQPAERAEGV